MTWDHRIIKRTYPDAADTPVLYGIHEVYYNADGTIWSYTKEPVQMQEECVDDLYQSLKWMMKCLDKEILVYDEIETVDYNCEDELDE